MPEMRNSIAGPVGDPNKIKGAANQSTDLRTVQGLLNVQIIKDNLSDRLLEITDRINDETVKAIIAFQLLQGFPQTGVVEPCDNTLNALSKFEPPSGMRASQSMIDVIQCTEHFEARLYNDGADNATVGYGHLVHLGPVDGTEPAEFKNGIDRERAGQIFCEDLSRDAEEPLNRMVEVPLTQNQFDALASLVFNIGDGNLQHSTLLRRLNAGDYLEAGRQFCVWDEVRVRGSLRVCTDLERRRKTEEDVFLRR